MRSNRKTVVQLLLSICMVWISYIHTFLIDGNDERVQRFLWVGLALRCHTGTCCGSGDSEVTIDIFSMEANNTL